MMLRFSTAKLLIFSLLVVGGFFFLYNVSLVSDPADSASQSDNLGTSTETVAFATSTEPLVPQRLSIPKINVGVAVEPVGTDADGNMTPPNDWRSVSWYEPGFRPGEVGNAVFAGHLDWTGNRAVFWDLDQLQSGDVVLVEGGGRVLTYVVTAVEVYDYDVVDTSPIFGMAGGSQIKLITCDGEFIAGSDTYGKRLVVTARLVRT